MTPNISDTCEEHKSLQLLFYKQNLYICEPVKWRRDGILLGKCSWLYTTVRTSRSVKKEGLWNYSVYFFNSEMWWNISSRPWIHLGAFLFPGCCGNGQVSTTTCSSSKPCPIHYFCRLTGEKFFRWWQILLTIVQLKLWTYLKVGFF